MTQKTFVLGLGAPKSGTTWLHRYISAEQGSNLGIRKEYRIWPAKLAGGPLKSQFNFRRLFKIRHGIVPVMDRGQLVRLSMFLRDGYYENYFSGLVRGENWLTGDISPGYMTMSGDQMRTAADRIRAAGFRLKVVFLMRDPIERSWSGARMHKRNGVEEYAGLTDSQAVDFVYKTEGHSARTRYDLTLKAIDEAFDPEDVFLGIFEELFSNSEVDRLSSFLGVEPRYELVSKKVNITQKDGRLDPDLIARMKDHFAPVYEACNQRFPQTRDLWN